MIITDPRCLRKIIWNNLNKIQWQLKKGLQWVNILLLTKWVSRQSEPNNGKSYLRKSSNVNRPIHQTMLTPIPGASHDKITLPSGASRVEIHRTRPSRESSNESSWESSNVPESRVIERERVRAENLRTWRDETRRDSRKRPAVLTARDAKWTARHSWSVH